MWLIFHIFRDFLETNWSSFSQCIAHTSMKEKWNILLNGKVSQFLSLLLPKNGQHSHCKCIHIQRLQSSSSKSKARRLQPVKSTLCKKGSFNSEPPAAPRIPSTATTTYHIWTSEIKSSYASTNKSAWNYFGQRKKNDKNRRKKTIVYEWMNEWMSGPGSKK